MTPTFPLTLPIPQHPGGFAWLDVVFNVTRGRLLKSRIDTSLQGFRWGSPPAFPAPDNVLRLQMLEDPPHSTEVKVFSAFEPLDLVKYVVRDASKKAIAVYAVDEALCPGSAEFLSRLARADLEDPTDPRGSSFDAREYLKDVTDELAAHPPAAPATLYRKYFAELDRHTNPNLLTAMTLPQVEKDNRIMTIRWAMTKLRKRVSKRCKDGPNATVGLSSVAGPYTAFLSALQLRILRDKLPGPRAHTIDWDHVAEAYEMFANGQLRFRLPNLAWTTQPSSGYYFFFAEFALMAIELLRPTTEWKKAIDVLTRTQKIFSQVYRPRSMAKAVYSSYRACNYNPFEALAGSEKKDLATEHKKLVERDGVAKVTTSYARAAFPGLGPQ